VTFQLRLNSLRALVGLDLPPFVASLATAELFFKFGSFLLEALAFLSVWYATSAVYGRVVRAATSAYAR
jgi:hypothetical protein